MKKIDIRCLTKDELKKEMNIIEEKPFRANQIFLWVHKKAVKSFNEINNLPDTLKDKLSSRYKIGQLNLKGSKLSSDGSEKCLFELEDGKNIETVFIPSKTRKTVCISTQVGCKYGCLFCASGKSGFKRDLTAGEIVSQVMFMRSKYDITNYVFMGMGEPLDNFDNVVKALIIMTDKTGMAIGQSRITLSTCGIIPGIIKLIDIDLRINLAISLHAANNSLRDKLVPINKKYPLSALIDACREYTKKKKNTLTLEYVVLRDTNNSKKDAHGLCAIAKKTRAKVNLIAYSPIPGMCFSRPSGEDMETFVRYLKENDVSVTIRQSKGREIQAACGQLALKENA